MEVNFYDGTLQMAVFRHYIVSNVYDVSRLVYDDNELSFDIKHMSDDLRRKLGHLDYCEEMERMIFLLGLGVITEDFFLKVAEITFTSEYYFAENNRTSRAAIYNDMVAFEQAAIYKWRAARNDENDDDIAYHNIYKYLLFAINNHVQNEIEQSDVVSFAECMHCFNDTVVSDYVDISNDGYMYIRNYEEFKWIAVELAKHSDHLKNIFMLIDDNGENKELRGEVLFEAVDKAQRYPEYLHRIYVRCPMTMLCLMDVYGEKYGKDFILHTLEENNNAEGNNIVEFDKDFKTAYKTYVENELVKYTITVYCRKRRLFDSLSCDSLDYRTISVGSTIKFGEMQPLVPPSTFLIENPDEHGEKNALKAVQKYKDNEERKSDGLFCFENDCIIRVINMKKQFLFIYDNFEETYNLIDENSFNKRYCEGYADIVNKVWNELRDESVTVERSGEDVRIVKDIVGHSDEELKLIENIAKQQVKELEFTKKTKPIKSYDELMREAKEYKKALADTKTQQKNAIPQ